MAGFFDKYISTPPRKYCCDPYQIRGGATVTHGGGMGPNLPPPPLVPNCTPLAVNAHAFSIEWTTHNIPVGHYTRFETSLVQGGPYGTDGTPENHPGTGEATRVERAETEHMLDNIQPSTTYFWVVREYIQDGDLDPNNDVLVRTSRECSFTTRAEGDENYFRCAPIIPQTNPDFITGGFIAAQVGVASPEANFTGLTEISTSPDGPWVLATGSQANPILAPNGANTYGAWQSDGTPLAPDTDYWLQFTYTWQQLGQPDQLVQTLTCGPYHTSVAA